MDVQLDMNTFDQIDKNKDGVISREEFVRAFRQMGIAVEGAKGDAVGGVGCGGAFAGSTGLGGGFEGNGDVEGGLAAIGNNGSDVTTAMSMNKLFMDNSKNWRSIADIAKALVIIEADEQLFVDAMVKLPGGVKIVRALREATAGDGALPPGWEEQVDPATGKTFYVNKATGQTSWVKPENLPPGWEKQIDPATGKPVYVNPTTGEMSWNKPEPLPEGWEQQVDPATGKPVYVDKKTGQRTSERPGPLPPGWEEQVDPATGQPIYVNKSTGQRTPMRPEILPLGWEKRIDPATGQPVYVNPSTGQQSLTKPPVSPRDFAMAQVHAAIEDAKVHAGTTAAQATKKAVEADQAATDAKILADRSDAFDAKNDVEHKKLMHAVGQAKDAEEKADKEAKRLADMAARAAQEAQQAAAIAAQAQQHATHHGHYVQHCSQKAQQAKQAADAYSQSLGPGAPDLSTVESHAVTKAAESKRAQEDAAQAMQKAKAMLDRAQKLQQASAPGGALEQLVQVQAEVDDAHKAKSLAVAASKRVAGLEALMALLGGEITRAREIALVRGRDADAKQTRAAQAMQQSQAIQDQLDLHVEQGEDVSASGFTMHLSPGEAKKAVQQAFHEATQAHSQAQGLAAHAQQTTQAAQVADQNLQQTKEAMDLLPNVDETDEEYDRARLAAARAKANADAMAEAARAAAEHASVCHQRYGKACQNVETQKAHAAKVHGQQQMLWKKRFANENLPAGWTGEVDPATGQPFFVGPNGQRTWNKPGSLPSGWRTEIDPQTGETIYVGPHGERTSLPPGWKSEVDPATGKTCYIGPHGEKQFNKPGSMDLPPGWKAEVDPATGRTYYVGPSGETSWTKPGDLPPGWRAETDPATGKTYYVGPNGQTSWTKPDGGDLPPGWREMIDPATGRKYYVSPTGEWQWDRPGEGAREEAYARQKKLDVKKAMDLAEEKRVEAELLEQLTQALERTMQQRAMLEDIVARIRKEAITAASEADAWAERTEVAAMKVMDKVEALEASGIHTGVNLNGNNAAPGGPPGAAAQFGISRSGPPGAWGGSAPYGAGAPYGGANAPYGGGSAPYGSGLGTNGPPDVGGPPSDGGANSDAADAWFLAHGQRARAGGLARNGVDRDGFGCSGGTGETNMRATSWLGYDPYKREYEDDTCTNSFLGIMNVFSIPKS